MKGFNAFFKKWTGIVSLLILGGIINEYDLHKILFQVLGEIISSLIDIAGPFLERLIDKITRL